MWELGHLTQLWISGVGFGRFLGGAAVKLGVVVMRDSLWASPIRTLPTNVKIRV